MRVRGLGDGRYFDEIFVGKAANRHGVCKFRQRIGKKDFAAYRGAVGQKIGVEMDNGRPIFFGEIAEVLIEQNFGGSFVDVTAHSISTKTDEISETRIFQNPDKNFGDILNSTRLNLNGCALTLDEKFSAQKCPEIILQDAETNFNFMRRLAEWKGFRVWVNDTRRGTCTLKVAARADDSTEELADEHIIRLKIGRRGEIRTAELVTDKYFELGRVLKLRGNPCEFLVVAQEIRQVNGGEQIFLQLEEFKNLPPKNFPATVPVKLTAKVVDINDGENFGRLRVQFDIEDRDDKKIFLPYRTPYSGIIFLPEIGDTVEVVYFRGECFVDSVLRTKAVDEEFRKVVDKYIGNNRKQRIFFREKSLEIKSADTSIFMDAEKIVLSVGENKLTLDAQGVTLKTGGKFVADIDKDFSAKVGGKIAAESSSDTTLKTSGKFVAEANGVAQIGGSKVELG